MDRVIRSPYVHLRPHITKGVLKGEGAASTARPTHFLKKNLTSLALKIQNSELPSLLGGTARTAAESKGFHQAGPQALRNGR